MTFAAGQTQAFVEVMIIDDSVYETQECFMAMLELLPGSSGVQLGQQSRANAVIADNDGMSKSIKNRLGLAWSIVQANECLLVSPNPSHIHNLPLPPME